MKLITAVILWKKGKDPHPKTRFSIWTLLRTPGHLTTRSLPVYSTTKMSVVRPFRSLVRTKLALSKTGRFLSKAESLGVGVKIQVACYRTEEAQIPKSARESPGVTAGSSAGRPLWSLSLEKHRNGTAPSSLPSSILFPGTLPWQFEGFGLSQSCSRRSRFQP